MATPKTLQEILALEDINQKIAYLKKGRRTAVPDTGKNLADWKPSKHDIMNPELYKKIKVLVKMEETKFDPETGRTTKTPAKYEMKEPNRISLPIEQDRHWTARPKTTESVACSRPSSRYSRKTS